MCWNLYTREVVLPRPLNVRGSPREGGYTYISLGYFHICGYTEVGDMDCWGPTMTRYRRFPPRS